MLNNNVHPTHENAIRILEIAWQLFQQKGYRGTSVDEICQACQLTKPTLYYYFGDKEALFVTVLSNKLQGFKKATEGNEDLSTKLIRVAELVLSSFTYPYSGLIQDRTHLKREGSKQQLFAAFQTQFFQPLTDLMSGEMKTGLLKKANPEMLTLIYLGALNNFIGQQDRFGSPASIAAEVVTCFLRGAASA